MAVGDPGIGIRFATWQIGAPIAAFHADATASVAAAAAVGEGASLRQADEATVTVRRLAAFDRDGNAFVKGELPARET